MDEIKTMRQEIERLQERLRSETESRIDMEKRCQLLEKLAYRDPGTGLRTETYLQARVREEIDRAIRFPSATSLVTLVAPREQDAELSMLGQRLTDELRSTDQVFRLGDHGLAILLVETPEDGARRVLDRLSQDLEHFVQGYGYTVTSFPVDANLADEFISMAMTRHQSLAQRYYPEEYSNGGHMTIH
jgi:GGDEF domain-containing protein